jgi:hypothetical protein
MLPLFDKSGYGIVAGVWCNALTESRLGRAWVIVDCLFTYTAISIMVGIFSVIMYRLRNQDARVVKNVHFGIGGYVMITILVWLPRIVLFSNPTRSAYLVIHLLPDISAVFYALLYYQRRPLLYQFESDVSSLPSVSAEFSLSAQFDRSASMTGDSNEFTRNPVHVKVLEAVMTDLARLHAENGIIPMQRGGAESGDIESQNTSVAGSSRIGISSDDMTIELC